MPTCGEGSVSDKRVKHASAIHPSSNYINTSILGTTRRHNRLALEPCAPYASHGTLHGMEVQRHRSRAISLGFLNGEIIQAPSKDLNPRSRRALSMTMKDNILLDSWLIFHGFLCGGSDWRAAVAMFYFWNMWKHSVCTSNLFAFLAQHSFANINLCLGWGSQLGACSKSLYVHGTTCSGVRTHQACP